MTTKTSPHDIAQAIATGMGDTQAALSRKALSDADFRHRLLKDPRGVLTEFLGRELPPGVQIQVHQDTAKSMHLILPPSLPATSDLTDEELERIAGGTDITVTLSILVTSLTILSGLMTASAVTAVSNVTVTAIVATVKNEKW